MNRISLTDSASLISNQTTHRPQEVLPGPPPHPESRLLPTTWDNKGAVQMSFSQTGWIQMISDVHLCSKRIQRSENRFKGAAARRCVSRFMLHILCSACLVSHWLFQPFRFYDLKFCHITQKSNSVQIPRPFCPICEPSHAALRRSPHLSSAEFP